VEVRVKLGGSESESEVSGEAGSEGVSEDESEGMRV